MVDLGVVDSALITPVPAGAGATSWGFTSRYAGLVSVEIAGDTAAKVTINSTGVSHSTALPFTLQVDEGQFIRLDVTGGVTSSELRITPLVTRRGNVLVIEGSSGDDVIRFDEYGEVSINRASYPFSPNLIERVLIDAHGGMDLLKVNGRYDSSRVTFSPGRIQLSRPEFQLVGSSGYGAASRAGYDC